MPSAAKGAKTIRGLGMKALGVRERQVGTAGHALENVHQIVMADQTQRIDFAKAKAVLVADGWCGNAGLRNGWSLDFAEVQPPWPPSPRLGRGVYGQASAAR